jgi:hypothetical protein
LFSWLSFGERRRKVISESPCNPAQLPCSIRIGAMFSENS